MPFGLRFAKAAPMSTPDVNEIGQTGTAIAKGIGGANAGFGAGFLLDTDYNAELQGTKLYDEVDRMRLSDSIVKGMLQAIKLPLLSAEWTFEPGDDTPQQQEIADWLTEQLEHMNWSWRTVLRHILLYLDYGVMPFEVVFKMTDDNKVALRKLAPRMPRTIIEWSLDENGGLAGVVQQVGTLDGFKRIPIPIERMLVFINELEGSNYRGISILRAARKDWYYKDRFQKLGGIIMEKRGAGIDVGKLRNGDPTKKSQAERVLMDVRSHERAFVLETEDFDYRIEGAGAGKTLDPLPWVTYYDASMLRGLLAEFLAIGGDGGSYALHADKTSLFLMAIRGIAGEVCDTFNRHLVQRWCDMNWPNLDVYPKLRHSRLDRRDAVAVVEAIVKLVPIKALTVDPDLESELRDLLELPELAAPEEIPDVSLSDAPSDPPVAEVPPAELVPRPSPYKASRATERVNWVALSTGMDIAERNIVASMKRVQARQIDVLVREATKRATSNGDLDGIAVPYKADATTVVLEHLVTLFKLGQKSARAELEVNNAIELSEPIDDHSFLTLRAKLISSVLAERLRGSMLRNATAMITRKEFDETALKTALMDLSDKAIITEANHGISEALNLGRNSIALANKDKLTLAEYSSLLDEATCDPCDNADGLVFKYGSAKMFEYEPPYKRCEGRDRCRCVLLFS